MSDEPVADRPPNPTAVAIAAWLRQVANRHREAAAAKEPFFRAGIELGPGSQIDGTTLRAFAQLNLTEATLLEVLAHQVERRSWPTEGPAAYVHHLHHGVTACCRSDVPGNWPPGQKWSADWVEVTCPACLKALG